VRLCALGELSVVEDFSQRCLSTTMRLDFKQSPGAGCYSATQPIENRKEKP